MYDYLIVGAGLFGATFARLATDAGKSCLVIDKRNHIGGNCYTENSDRNDIFTIFQTIVSEPFLIPEKHKIALQNLTY